MVRFPRYATAIALACVLGACSADDPMPCEAPPKCICKPTMYIELGDNPRALSLCNNSTFNWLIHTMLAEVAKQTEEVATKNTFIATLWERLKEAEEAADDFSEEVVSLSTQVEHLQKENTKLLKEVEGLRAHHSKVDVRPQDCADVQKYGFHYSGIYTLYPRHLEEGLEVFCDLNTDGGGWLVFQRRQDGSQNFSQNWEKYKNGFGRNAKEFWLGNEHVHKISQRRQYELRVDMTDFDGRRGYAIYKNFSLEGEDKFYKLHISEYSGNAGDALSHHSGLGFTTTDVDNDESKSGQCSQLFGGGGWWFVRCYDCNLNGLYGVTHGNKGIIWHQWKENHEPLRHVEMKIRPIGF